MFAVERPGNIKINRRIYDNTAGRRMLLSRFHPETVKNHVHPACQGEASAKTG
jgi:hypothetical protein